MGSDKLSFDGRAQWTEDNLEELLRVPQDPFKYDMWQKADDQWQALAAILELGEAYKLEDPAEFVSHLHIHVDGSCNGL